MTLIATHWGWRKGGGGGRRSKQMWYGWLQDVDVCVCMFCWPFMSRQAVQLWSCGIMVWYQFLRRVMKITGKETRYGPILHEKKVLPWDHFGNRVPIGTLYLLLVSNLPNSTVTRNSVSKVFRRERCSRSAPTCFFWLASDKQMSTAVRACTQAKPILSRHACASQELRNCQEQQQHTNTHLAQ